MHLLKCIENRNYNTVLIIIIHARKEVRFFTTFSKGMRSFFFDIRKFFPNLRVKEKKVKSANFQAISRNFYCAVSSSLAFGNRDH